MKTIKDLTNGSEIRVRGILGRITITTLVSYLAECNALLSESEQRDIDNNRKTQYAWTMQHAGVIEADYKGKAEKLAEERQKTAAAPEVETGDVLIIDGVPYLAKVAGDYADPVHLTRFELVNPAELAATHNVVSAASGLIMRDRKFREEILAERLDNLAAIRAGKGF